MVRRGEIWLARFDPTVGSEIRKTRPGLVVSPDEINYLRTALFAPLTTGSRPTPFRINCMFEEKSGLIVLDQMRALDRGRLVRRLGRIDGATLDVVLATLRELFAD